MTTTAPHYRMENVNFNELRLKAFQLAGKRIEISAELRRAQQKIDQLQQEAEVIRQTLEAELDLELHSALNYWDDLTIEQKAMTEGEQLDAWIVDLMKIAGRVGNEIQPLERLAVTFDSSAEYAILDDLEQEPVQLPAHFPPSLEWIAHIKQLRRSAA